MNTTASEFVKLLTSNQTPPQMFKVKGLEYLETAFCKNL